MKTKLIAALMGVAALGCAYPTASADYLGHRTTDIAFAKDDFSTWTPRKGKMTYERDDLQPEWGKGGRNSKYKVSCARLQKYVGPGGIAKDGDEIVVVNAGKPCKLDTLSVHRAVLIQAENPPAFRSAYLRDSGGKIIVGDRTNLDDLKDHNYDFVDIMDEIRPALTRRAADYSFILECSTTVHPCITVNVDADKTVEIKGFHVKTNSWLLAPLVENRSGKIVLTRNYFEGEARLTQGRKAYMERATALLIHGSGAKIVGNTFAYARSGITLLPTQTASKGSRYVLIGNAIVNMGESGIVAEGAIFSAQLPHLNVNLHSNQVLATYGGATLRQVNSVLEGNIFGIADTHVYVAGGVSHITKNRFHAADTTALVFDPGTTVYNENNLFQDNSNIAIGMTDALLARSPIPMGNICKNQNFLSFYRGRPHVLMLLDVNAGTVVPRSTASKRPDRRAIRNSQKNEPGLWAAYEEYLGGYTKTEEEKEAEKKSRRSRRSVVEMWPAFKAYYYRSKDPVLSHILFEQMEIVSGPESQIFYKTGLDPSDGYYGCLDYATLYKPMVRSPTGDKDGDIFD